MCNILSSTLLTQTMSKGCDEFWSAKGITNTIQLFHNFNNKPVFSYSFRHEQEMIANKIAQKQTWEPLTPYFRSLHSFHILPALLLISTSLKTLRSPFMDWGNLAPSAIENSLNPWLSDIAVHWRTLSVLRVDLPLHETPQKYKGEHHSQKVQNHIQTYLSEGKALVSLSWSNTVTSETNHQAGDPFVLETRFSSTTNLAPPGVFNNQFINPPVLIAPIR